ncbi:MAG: hypothetical protein WCA21_11955 [Terracidiphilus sp.]
MRGSIIGVMALVAGMALPAAGQVVRNQTTRVEIAHPRVALLPYTAEYKITRIRTLGDGSTITQESTETVALDSQGRRMTATTSVPLTGDQIRKTRVTVFDPVAHTNSIWGVPGEKMTVMQMPLPGAARPSCAAATPGSTAMPARIPNKIAPNAIRPITEDLGTDTIQGVEARGHRTTITTPAGTIGNDAPLVRTNEVWTASAPGLRGLLVRSVSDDPQAGKMNRELTNFTQAEPDASVFQPPSDYEIVNKDATVSNCSGTESSEPVLAPIPPPPPPPEQ